MSSPDISLRPITAADEPFLAAVYFSTREEEMAMTGWGREQIEAFLDFQFRAQHTYYQDSFSDAAFDVVLVDGEPAGRLYLDRRGDEIRIIDIALLPAFRGRKIGYRLLRAILDEAQELGQCVRIHVEQKNPALQLYLRLGFEHIDELPVYFLMEWRPKRSKIG